MEKEYFKKVFAGDFSVRGEAKEEYNENLIQKIVRENNDVIICISGAKMKHINTLCQSAMNKGVATDKTVRLVFLNGSVDKAVYQDSTRDRSAGEEFVRQYAERIETVWHELMDPNSPNYFKKKNIYKVYELKDIHADDELSHPAWKLVKTFVNDRIASN